MLVLETVLRIRREHASGKAIKAIQLALQAPQLALGPGNASRWLRSGLRPPYAATSANGVSVTVTLPDEGGLF